MGSPQMPHSPLRIPNEGHDALQALVGLGDSGVESLKQALETTGPILVPPRTRAVLVSEALPGDDAADVDQIEMILIFALMSLHAVQSQLKVSSQELHGMVALALNEELSGKWRQLEAPLVALLDSDVLRVESKARWLLRQQPNPIESARILSDVRPVFDEPREHLTVSLVLNTLRLRYDDGSDSRTMSFALDDDLLEDLEQQIARARRKNAILREQYNNLNFVNPSDEESASTQSGEGGDQ